MALKTEALWGLDLRQDLSWVNMNELFVSLPAMYKELEADVEQWIVMGRKSSA